MAVDDDTVRIGRLLDLRDRIEESTDLRPIGAQLALQTATFDLIGQVGHYLKVPVVAVPFDGLVYSAEAPLMSRQRITTRSGSVYVYDRDARTVTWTMPDGEKREYTAITDAVVHVGYPFVYAGTRDRCGKPMSRRTTPVVSIEEDTDG